VARKTAKSRSELRRARAAEKRAERQLAALATLERILERIPVAELHGTSVQFRGRFQCERNYRPLGAGRVTPPAWTATDGQTDGARRGHCGDLAPSGRQPSDRLGAFPPATIGSGRPERRVSLALASSGVQREPSRRAVGPRLAAPPLGGAVAPVGASHGGGL